MVNIGKDLTTPILTFDGDYHWLSNFYKSPVNILGQVYLNSEAAFQACKTECLSTRMDFTHMGPYAAKKAGRKLKLRAGWNNILRVEMMELVLRAKFTNNELRDLLKCTMNRNLIEGNTWGDTYWGVCRGKGENMLGKLLMEIRKDI